MFRASFPVRPGAMAAREALALARQAVLLAYDLDEICPSTVEDGDDVVVLLHGLFASAGVLRPLRLRIEREAAAYTASFSYFPGPGIRSLALRLSDLVERLPRTAHVHLIGHSVGGVIARYYLQLLAPTRDIAQTISIASPFRGTPTARWLPGPIRADLQRGSEVLRAIEQTAESLRAKVPHTSIVASDDAMVPPESSLFYYGDTVVMNGRGHNALLFDDEVQTRVVALIRAERRVLAPAVPPC